MITLTLVLSAAGLIVYSDVKAAEMADETKERVLEMMRELNEGKEVECEPMMRLLLGIARDDDFDPGRIAHQLGIEESERMDCEGLMRMLLGLADDESLDNQQLLKLLLGIREDSKVTDEQILQLLESSYSNTKRPV
jgi:hypothetical protein